MTAIWIPSENLRQIMNKEAQFQKGSVLKALEENKDKMDAKNTYMNYFKTEKVIMQETKKEQKETLFIYDQVMADKFPKMYCQKSKYESVWDKNVRPREEPLKIQNAPLTTS